jgi:hypothetical protein
MYGPFPAPKTIATSIPTFQTDKEAVRRSLLRCDASILARSSSQTILEMAPLIIPPVLEFSSTACDMLEQYCISRKEE